jgi:hypothetical protein
MRCCFYRNISLCVDLTPKTVWVRGSTSSIMEHHILKHHILELRIRALQIGRRTDLAAALTRPRKSGAAVANGPS